MIKPLHHKKVALQQMRVWKLRLSIEFDEALSDAVRDCRDAAMRGIMPWSYYHLARDEQINRTLKIVGIVLLQGGL
jgi:hypothetical protein